MASACFKTTGGNDEICNFEDDNGDGLTDEPFVDENGVYPFVENCGDCGIDCRRVFPSAETVACVPSNGGPVCEIETCPEGTHLVGASACVPDRDITCLPCTIEADCRAADPTSGCVSMPFGDRRCLRPCAEDDACDEGRECREVGEDRFCVPVSGHCACVPEAAGRVFGCWLGTPLQDRVCYGTQVCDGETLSLCAPIHEEQCDGVDNDCDGLVDEEFIRDGVYLTDAHCGACNHPCGELAPNTTAECRSIGGEPTCVRECEDNHVDLDGLSLNGCECFKVISVWPPLSFGGDMNCDGTVDDTSDFIFVARTGDDANPGTLDAPVATVNRGIALAEPLGLTVIVAQGRYDEQVVLQANVSVFGGYRSDFGDYDPVLFEVVIERLDDTTGLPVLLADGITQETEISGLTLVGAGAGVPGGGSTAVLVRDCSEPLYLHDLRIVSGTGADGADGRSSAEILERVAGVAVAQLDGTDGAVGNEGYDARAVTCIDERVAGGAGGEKTCPGAGADVSGGSGGDADCPATGCRENQPCANAGCADYMMEDGCDFSAMQAEAVPNPAASDGRGPGGGKAGPVTYDAPTTRAGSNYCADDPSLQRDGGNGEPGASGVDGSGGAGCQAPLGHFDATTGLWTSDGGQSGTDGGDGSGGGGGTQGNGYDVLEWNSIASYATDQLGGSGGGGGSGGCGAPGAEAGSGGGGVIGMAIVLTALGSGPVVQDVRVVPARAGDGGDGGIGAAGGAPGTGGNGGVGNFWCARRGGRGGDGGAGGAGGGGGGGCGGSISGFHVVAPLNANGEAYLDMLRDLNHVDPLPAPGSAGNGGFSPRSPGADGAAGSAEAFRLFPVPSS